MAEMQRLREALSGSPTLEYLNRMSASGWRLAALEWERETPDGQPENDAPPESLGAGGGEEVPYGLQVSADCRHLIENPAEMRVLMAAVNMIVDDLPLSLVAEELNRQGCRTRNAERWTAAAVFKLLPRMIEAGPRIFTREEWIDRRRRLTRD